MPVQLRRTLRGTLALAAAGTLLLAGCTAASNSAPSGAGASDSRTSTLVYAYNNEVTTLDPARTDYLQVDTVDQSLYDTLLGYEDGKMVPRLASGFTYSADVTSVDVTLRADAVFHDGTPVTAADVAYTFDRYKRLGVGIVGQIASYDSSTVVDDTHVTLHLTQPDALFMGALSRIDILNADLVSTNAGTDDGQGWLLDHDAGSGPYQLDSATAGTFQTTRFADYWDFDEKRPETLVFKRVDEHSTIAADLQAGTVDVGQVDANAQDALSAKGLEVDKTPGGSQVVIYFNTTHGTAANPAVREALRAAFDYPGALSSIYSGQGTIANGPTPTSLSCRPDLPTAQQDLDKAKQLLADAGLAGTSLTMRYQPVFDQQAQAATLLQSNLKEIGVTLNLEPIAFADYLTSLGNPETIPDIMLLAESAAFPDTGVMVTKTFWSGATTTNKAAYANPQVDALIEQANAEPDADTRCGLYSQAQELIDADSASMPLYTVQTLMGHRADIGGLDVMAAPGGLAIRELTVGN